MDAKIVSKVTLDFKLILRAQFLKNRFISIFYSVLFVIFGFMSLNIALNNSLSANELYVDIALVLLCAGVAWGYPLISALIWKIRTKKKYGVDRLELEYQFFDLSLKVNNLTNKTSTKLDYRAISRINKSKHLLILNYSSKIYIVIDKDQMKERQLERLMDYLKRLKLV